MKARDAHQTAGCRDAAADESRSTKKPADDCIDSKRDVLMKKIIFGGYRKISVNLKS